MKGILQAWRNKGFTSVDEVIVKETGVHDRHKRNSYATKPSREVVPEWFGKRNQKKQATEDEALTADQMKIEELLVAYGKLTG